MCVSVQRGLSHSNIKQFIDETFKPSFWASQSIKVHYSPVTGEWRVEGKSATGANDVNAYNTYGTSRMKRIQDT